jgi:hypothetical protein
MMAKVINLPNDNIDTADPYDIVKDGDKIFVVHEVTATEVVMKSGNIHTFVTYPRNLPGQPKPWHPMIPGRSYRTEDLKKIQAKRNTEQQSGKKEPIPIVHEPEEIPETPKTMTADIPDFGSL